MAPSTPQKSFSGVRTADFTRPQQPSSPTNLRTSKRLQTQKVNTLPPRRLSFGGNAPENNSAQAAIAAQLEAHDRTARIRREILNGTAKVLDQYVDSHKKQAEFYDFAQKVRDSFIAHLTAANYAAPNDLIPVGKTSVSLPSSQPALPTRPSSTVTWADRVTRGGTNIPKNPRDAKPALAKTNPSSSSEGSAGGASLKSLGTSEASVKQDKRILVGIPTIHQKNRQEPYAIRKEICKQIPGILMSELPKVTPTAQGWALHPTNLSVRDKLTSQENKEILLRIMHGDAVRLPEVWHTYAIQGVPLHLQDVFGQPIDITEEEIATEAFAQTGRHPISVRPSQHGPNLQTYRITWLVSFRDSVPSFRLFGASEQAHPIVKKTPITRHDPGCQGYCNPRHCTRYGRCSNCSKRIDQHEGPSGGECQHASNCANCHGPFPADHRNCPAAPNRKNGKIIKLTRAELSAIRKAGDRLYRDSVARRAAFEASSQVTGTGDRVISSPDRTDKRAAPPKRKRACLIAAYENSGSTPAASSPATVTGSAPATAPAAEFMDTSGAPSSDPFSSQSTSGRPTRQSGARKNLNLLLLSQQSVGLDGEGDASMSTSEPTC